MRGKLPWSIVDTGVSSLGNFVVSLVAASTLTREQFGAFAIVLTTYALALGLVRALCGDPLLVRGAGAAAEERVILAKGAVSGALIVGFAVAVVCGLAAFFLPEVTRGPMLVFGAFGPVLLVQDAYRYTAFAEGRPDRAALNDTVWTGLVIVGVVALHLRGEADATALVLLWAAAAVPAVLVGMAVADAVPRLRHTLPWFRSTVDLGGRFAVEFATSTGSSQVAFYGVAAVAGISALGTIRAAGVLFGPITVVSMGVSVWAIPEAGKLLRGRASALLAFTLRVSAVLALAALVWTGLLALVPTDAGIAAFGENWEPAMSVLVPFGLMTALFAFSSAPLNSLRALGAAKQSLRTRLVLVIPRLALVVMGAVFDGPRGAMWGSVLVTGAGGIVWWRALRRVFDRHVRGKGDAYIPRDVL